MALGPVSNHVTPLPAPTPSRDAAGAQRAFFQAALGQAAPVAGVTPVSAQTAPASQPQPPRASAPADAPKPAYRPGSLLDIRI